MPKTTKSSKRKMNKSDESEQIEPVAKSSKIQKLWSLNPKPMQPPVPYESLYDLILKYDGLSLDRWSKKDILFLGKKMANASGFYYDGSKQMASAKVSHFILEYIKFTESNDEFCRMIDPIYLLCTGTNAHFSSYVKEMNDHLAAVNEYNGHNAVALHHGMDNFLVVDSLANAQSARDFLHAKHANEDGFHTTLLQTTFSEYV